MADIVKEGKYAIYDGWFFPEADELKWLVKDGCPVLELPVNRRKIARRKLYDRYIFCPKSEIFYIVNKNGGEFYC